MRFIAYLVGLVAALAGCYGAFVAMQAVGPKDQTDDFGFGDGATISPGGGDLFESKNFALVVAALKRELGPDGRISYLRVERTAANATGKVGDIERNVQIDASGRSRATDGDKADLRAWMPVSKLDPAAIDVMVREAQKQARALVETLNFQSNNREWNVDMDGGEPDAFIANLDGGGLRLSGEPNPVGIGATPDSLLRAENLEKVIAAARKEAPADARVTGFDIRPDRVSFGLDTGGRTLTLDYGYDAQLTGRNLAAKTGAPTASVTWEQIEPEAIDRMARTANKVLEQKLADVQYVLLNDSFAGDGKPSLLMYFKAGADPPYGVADLHGRHFTWPGRG
ncbi:hypothetical protein [Solirubrobacter soli]|uniref:hypothetical protein n=1 Tax=Solirubrobacter soli TaxID=363832 RepID=UPI00040F9C54|nr:hypothetical protein [Solirubrobacter soli]